VCAFPSPTQKVTGLYSSGEEEERPGFAYLNHRRGEAAGLHSYIFLFFVLLPSSSSSLVVDIYIPEVVDSTGEREKMSGQTLTDRIAAAQYQLTGSDMARAVCKATTHEVMAPKKKHLECKWSPSSSFFPPSVFTGWPYGACIASTTTTKTTCHHMACNYDQSFLNGLSLNGVWCHEELMRPWGPIVSALR